MMKISACGVVIALAVTFDARVQAAPIADSCARRASRNRSDPLYIGRKGSSARPFLYAFHGYKPRRAAFISNSF